MDFEQAWVPLKNGAEDHSRGNVFLVITKNRVVYPPTENILLKYAV